MSYKAHLQSKSPSEESTDTPIFTPQSSMTSSPKMLASSPGLTRDVPIPTIESPDTTNPRMHADHYENFLDAMKEVNLNPQNYGSQFFNFGQEENSSPFTFRFLYSPTPEPVASVEQATPRQFSSSGSGSSLRPNIATPQTTQPQASSAPVQHSVPNRPPAPARYDSRDETPPDEPYFNKDFQRALQAGRSIARDIGSVLGTCELARDPQSQVFRMIQTANQLSHFDAPAVCKIGIMGDSGVGT